MWEFRGEEGLGRKSEVRRPKAGVRRQGKRKTRRQRLGGVDKGARKTGIFPLVFLRFLLTRRFIYE